MLTQNKRISPILAPAVAIMNRLKYPQKFALISLCFAIPLATVMFFLISEMNDRIEFSEKEIIGDAYLRPLRKLLEHVPSARSLAHSYAKGQITVRPELIELQSIIDQDFQELLSAEKQYGKILNTSSRLNVLSENWKFLKNKTLSLEASDTDTLYGKVIGDIRALVSHAGDTSNLILDPDLDSYYLMDSVLLKLPEGVDLVSRTSFFAQSILERGSMTAEEKAELITLTGLVRSNSEATRAGLQVGFRNNPAQNLKPALEEPVQNAVAQTEELLKAIDAEILDAPQLTTTQESLEALTRKTLEKDFSLWDRTVAELDGLLRTRIDGFERKCDWWK
ncbi:hypothetical protein L0222_30590 [bacterium]|nr:hypothetical protein [bacterium]